MTKMIISTTSEQQTRELGELIGKRLEAGTVIGLNGMLGAGKTRLTQGIGIGLEIEDGNVVSPTYTICTPHEGRLVILHLDAYRINHPEEVDELGLDEVVEQGAVLVIEWAEKIEGLIPPIDLLVKVHTESESKRNLEFEAFSEKGESLIQAIRSIEFATDE